MNNTTDTTTTARLLNLDPTDRTWCIAEASAQLESHIDSMNFDDTCPSILDFLDNALDLVHIDSYRHYITHSIDPVR